MGALLFFLYLALGLFQMAAIVVGLEEWIGLHWLLALPAALIIAYMPLLGTIVGMAGAVSGWGWSLSAAAALFLGPFCIVALVAVAAGGVGFLDLRRRRGCSILFGSPVFTPSGHQGRGRRLDLLYPRRYVDPLLLAMLAGASALALRGLRSQQSGPLLLPSQ